MKIMEFGAFVNF